MLISYVKLEKHIIYVFYIRKTTISVTNFRRRPLASGRGGFVMTDFPRRALAD